MRRRGNAIASALVGVATVAGLLATTAAPSVGARLPGGPTRPAALNGVVVGIATTPDGAGYWLVASDGGEFAYGDAGFYGSAGGLHLNAPIVGMTATPDGAGYWLVASDGGVFAYDDAGFSGSAGGLHLNAPVVGIAATSEGGGYWLAAADGGVFAYGDARFYGSAGALHLNAPMVAFASTPQSGYWMAAVDGGVFACGDADFYGSALNGAQAVHVTGMASTADGEGCWIVTAEGAVLTYGDAGYFGSPSTVIALYGDSPSMEGAPYFAYLAGTSHASVLLRAYNGWAICDDLPAMANDAATRHPTVAVIQFSGNSMTQCMSGYTMATPAYYDKYQADAQAAISIFQDAGIPIILIGLPLTAWANLSANVAFVNQVYQSLAASNLGVTYVDAGQAVLNQGNFTLTLPCLSFEPCTGPAGTNVVRSPDGVHFCPEGNANVQGPYAVCDEYASGAFRFAMAMLAPAMAY